MIILLVPIASYSLDEKTVAATPNNFTHHVRVAPLTGRGLDEEAVLFRVAPLTGRGLDEEAVLFLVHILRLADNAEHGLVHRVHARTLQPVLLVTLPAKRPNDVTGDLGN